jgi:hypothetical protein
MYLFCSGLKTKSYLATGGAILCALLAVGCNKQQPIQAKQESAPVQVRAIPVAARDVRADSRQFAAKQ